MSGWMVYCLLNGINVDWLDFLSNINTLCREFGNVHTLGDSAKRFTRTNLSLFDMTRGEKRCVY